jgi:hypothetical protein
MVKEKSQLGGRGGGGGKTELGGQNGDSNIVVGVPRHPPLSLAAYVPKYEGQVNQITTPVYALCCKLCSPTTRDCSDTNLAALC